MHGAAIVQWWQTGGYPQSKIMTCPPIHRGSECPLTVDDPAVVPPVTIGACGCVGVGVAVGVAVGVGVFVPVAVAVGVLVAVGVVVEVGVLVGVCVGVGVGVDVGVSVAVGVAVGVLVAVAVGVSVGVCVGVSVGVGVGVLVGVSVAVGVGVLVGVLVGAHRDPALGSDNQAPQLSTIPTRAPLSFAQSFTIDAVASLLHPPLSRPFSHTRSNAINDGG